MADPNLTPETLKALDEMHKDLARLRLLLHETLALTDKHIAILIRARNGAADQQGMTHATRKLFWALQTLGPEMNAWIKKYVRIGPADPPAGGVA